MNRRILMAMALAPLIMGAQARAADLQVETRTRVRVNLPKQTLISPSLEDSEGPQVQEEVVPVPPPEPSLVPSKLSCVEAKVVNIHSGEALVIREGPSQDTRPLGIIGPDYPVLVCGGFQGWARIKVCPYNPPGPCTEGWSSLKFLAPMRRD